MSLLQRASKLLKANVNHLLDTAEDPAVMVEQLIRDMEESMVELRRETVNAVARQKQLENKVKLADARTNELEEKAVLALEHGNKDLARRILAERVEVLKMRESLAKEQEGATSFATQLKVDLLRMNEQAALARRRKDELIRRQRAAEAQLRTREAARKSTDAMSAVTGRIASIGADSSAFAGYADRIAEIEARAEADRELTGDTVDDELTLRKLVDSAEVERELERLEGERASSA